MLAVGRPDGDVALGDRRIVVEQIDEIARRAELDRRIGRERHARHRVDQKPDVDELLREQDPVGIVERRPHLDGAGGHVDLAVKGGQRPGRQRMDIVPVEHRDRKLRVGIEPRRDALQIVLGRREHDADRIDLGDDDDAGGVGGLQVVSRIDEPEPHPAGNRRNDMGVGDVELGRLDHRLVGGDRRFVLGDQRDLVGDLLHGDRILLGELLKASEVALRLAEQRLVLGQLPLRLGQRGLIRTRIDLGDEVALPSPSGLR